jgi:mono/diheme cytochrome c family protein
MKGLMILLAASTSLAVAQGLTPQQQRGRAVYTEGRGSVTLSGKVLPARLFRCASCHGEDGRGQKEGGASVADITPQVLARTASAGQRVRPAYTPALLLRAIARGTDSAGQSLDRAMPRYGLASGDAAGLLAYLAVLDTVGPPGVSAVEIRINVTGAPGLAAPAVTVYGRRIVLRHDDPTDTLATIDGRPAPAASRAQQVAALRDYATARGAGAWLLADDCRSLSSAPDGQLVLLTADAAARCQLDELAPGRQVVVAAPTAPDAGATGRARLAQVVAVLQAAGRDFTSKRFTEALARRGRQHAGTAPVWLMTFDARNQTLLAEPGWWHVPNLRSE